jgi:Fe-S-cluster containining protein
MLSKMEKPFEINGESVDACRRCGTCCRRGGPALHLMDKPLVAEGHIPAERLYTIRSGERVRDDVAGGVLTAADAEIVKIRETPGSRACGFFDPACDGCTIYDRRPLECRVLRCWDTREIRRIYRRDRLGRRDLIGHIPGLWDLVVEHDRRCSAARLFQLADCRLGAAPPAVRSDDELRGMVAYDEALRRVLVEDGRASGAILDLLLGRPLSLLLRSVGITVDRRVWPVSARPGFREQDQPT